jgi:3-isopropylmalate/(R)-2-methylmalate dehydratase small subunit
VETVMRGKAWVFGDEIGNEEILATKYIQNLADNNDPSLYVEHLLELYEPNLAKLAQPGDVIVAGKRFSHGNMHWQVFAAMKHLGLGLVTESMPRGAFRNAVDVGLRVLPFAPGVTGMFAKGDEIEVNFGTGRIRNVTRGAELSVEPLQGLVEEIIAAGGGLEYLRAKAKRLGLTSASKERAAER